MKSVVDMHRTTDHDQSELPHREWTWRSVRRLLLAGAVLSLIFYLAGLVPVESEEAESGLLGSFVLFWFLGGLITITLLALSDRRG